MWICNPCCVTILLFNALHFSVYLFGFVILLKHCFLSHSLLLQFPPDLWFLWNQLSECGFCWLFPLEKMVEKTEPAVTRGSDSQSPLPTPLPPQRISAYRPQQEQCSSWGAYSKPCGVLDPCSGFQLQHSASLNWVKSLLVRHSATNRVKARLQQSQQDGKIIVNPISLPAPTVLLRTQGNWFSILASMERNLSERTSPKIEKSQLITGLIH